MSFSPFDTCTSFYTLVSTHCPFHSLLPVHAQLFYLLRVKKKRKHTEVLNDIFSLPRPVVHLSASSSLALWTQSLSPTRAAVSSLSPGSSGSPPGNNIQTCRRANLAAGAASDAAATRLRPSGAAFKIKVLKLHPEQWFPKASQLHLQYNLSYERLLNVEQWANYTPFLDLL